VFHSDKLPELGTSVDFLWQYSDTKNRLHGNLSKDSGVLRIGMSKYVIIGICLGLIALWIPFAHPQSGTLVTANTIAHDGLTRYFHYYVTDGIGTSPPLVILLHGGTRSYNQIISGTSAAQEWLTIADEEKFLIIIPNGVDPDNGMTDGEHQNWNDCRADDGATATGADDVGFISALVDWGITNFNVDTQRVYSTGASNGGMMSYRLAHELGHRIAAIACFIANEPAVSECTSLPFVVPTFICNGTSEDTFMPWDGGFVVDASRGTVTSAIATRDFWINRNGTSITPSEVINYPNLDLLDGTTASSARYDGGIEGAEVMFYTINNGGHTIPSINYPLGILALAVVGRQSNDIEGARHAWAFLSQHTLGSAYPPGLPVHGEALVGLVLILGTVCLLRIPEKALRRR